MRITWNTIGHHQGPSVPPQFLRIWTSFKPVDLSTFFTLHDRVSGGIFVFLGRQLKAWPDGEKEIPAFKKMKWNYVAFFPEKKVAWIWIQFMLPHKYNTIVFVRSFLQMLWIIGIPWSIMFDQPLWFATNMVNRPHISHFIYLSLSCPLLKHPMLSYWAYNQTHWCGLHFSQMPFLKIMWKFALTW